MKRKAGHIVSAAIVALVIITGLVIFRYRFEDIFKNDLFVERVAKLETYADYASEKARDVYTKGFEDVRSAEKYLMTMKIQSEEELYSALDVINYAFEGRNELFFAFTGTDFYTSDRQKVSWKPTKGTGGVATVTFTEIIFRMNVACADNKEHLIFLRVLESPLVVSDNITITCVALGVQTDNLDDTLGISAFGEGSRAYVVNGSMAVIFQNTSDNTDTVANDISEIHDKIEFRDGVTYEELTEALKSGKPTTYPVRFEQEDYLILTKKVEGTSWNLLMIVKEKSIGTDTDYYLHKAMILYVAVAVMFCLILITAGVFISTNYAKQKLVEQKEQTNIELQKSNELLLDAVNKANEANHAKSEFLSHMSHDIRTPINGIMGMSSIGLKNAENKAKVTDCFNKIDASSRHLLSLVNDILDMSRIESGKEKINRTPMSVLEMLNHVSSIISGQLVDRNLKFVCDFNIEHTEVIGDDLHIRQILINILGNAVKFTPDGGTIRFSAEEAQRDPDKKWILYRFVVADTGIGMQPEFIRHIFEPFVQADCSVRTSYQGTGLGLTITKQFVEMLDGNISVDSEPGKGSTFTVMIPIDINSEEVIKSAEAPDFSELLSGQRALIAEDNDLNAEVVESILDEAGIMHDLAADGKVAVDMFQKSEPGYYDVVLMDIMMPEMDGLEATRTIRSLDRPDAASVPIIAVTANTYEEDIEKTRAAGMNAHIGKPVSSDVLYKTIYNNTIALKGNLAENKVRKMRILLAEDNDLNAEIARELLAEEGITVKRAINGVEAYAIFTENPPKTFDAILMDLQMPIMGGIEATKMIRNCKSEDAKTIPIIAMTANAYDEDTTLTKEVGMNAHLTKPIEMNKLLETLKLLS